MNDHALKTRNEKEYSLLKSYKESGLSNLKDDIRRVLTVYTRDGSVIICAPAIYSYIKECVNGGCEVLASPFIGEAGGGHDSAYISVPKESELVKICRERQNG